MTDLECRMILKTYPEYISKEQMHRICHISKKTCLFLLESGLVANTDCGKATYRFRIKTTDVVRYLKDRERHPQRYKPPDGFYSGGTARIAENVSCEPKGMRKYYEDLLKEQPDVLTVAQTAQITGYSINAVRDWCSQERVRCFSIRKRLYIPKTCLLEFLSERGGGARSLEIMGLK